ncbi:MAG: hypothetical protein AAF250_10810 [Pseudomonadota bacterium]
MIANAPAPLLAQDWRQRFRRPPRFSWARNVRPPSREAQTALNLICDVAGLERTITLYQADVQRGFAAFATTKRGRRYIVYDPVAVPFPPGTISWDSMWVMAHEVAHHMAGHNFRRDIPEKHEELEGDRIAGGLLYKLGASEAQALSRFSSNRPDSRTHPSDHKRREETRDGWLLAQRVARRERALREQSQISD